MGAVAGSSTPAKSYTLLILSRPTPLVAMVCADAVAGVESGISVGGGGLASNITGSTIIRPASALSNGLKVPALKSYTHRVYSGGASCTLGPAVLPALHTLVAAGVTVVSSTRQGDQLTSMRLVPS